MNVNGFIEFTRNLYGQSEAFIPLHPPTFIGNEKKYLNECIDSTFVSSVGHFVTRFEDVVAKYTGAKYAVATSNGTSALHIALILAGVEKNTEVITQPLTFVATVNAISYCNASPVFVDVDKHNMGMSADSLNRFFEVHVETRNEAGKLVAYNITSGKRISAVLPMHTFGFPCEIEEIISICNSYGVPVVEDAAESLGSYIGDKHTGTFGRLSCLSFNGNKTITTGGGGMILTNDETLAKKAKHLTTTAKVPHKWEYVHDHIGYNYRLTNLAAALGVAQMESLPEILRSKRKVAMAYEKYFENSSITHINEAEGTTVNYWLNAVILDPSEKESFLEETNNAGIMTRPIWQLMNDMNMFKDCFTFEDTNAKWLSKRVVNIPSGSLL